MAKRIISVAVLVIAISALGLILVGAFTSGEQLTIRFITAVVVASVSLYIISDLRLSSETQAKAAAMRGVAVSSVTADSAAFMNTVTGRESTITAAAHPPATPTHPPFPAPSGPRRPTAKVPVTPVVKPATAASDPKAEVEPFNSKPQAAAAPTRRRTQPNPPTMTLKSVATRPHKKSSAHTTPQTGQPQPPATHAATTSPSPTSDRRRFQPRTTEVTRKRLEGLIQELTCTSDSFILKTYEPAAPTKDIPESATPTEIHPTSPTGQTDHRALASGPIGPLGPNPTTPFPRAADIPSTNPKVDSNPPPTSSPATEEDMQHFTNGPDGRDTYDETADLSEPSALDSIPQGELETLITLFARRSATAQAQAKPPVTSFDSFLDDDDLAEDDPVIATADLEPLPLHPPVDKNLTVAITNTTELNLPFDPEDSMQVASYANPTIAPIINLAEARENAITTEVEAAIIDGEQEVVSSLIQRGLLTTNGPISDRDVRTMVYVAFTSTELRNILLSGGKVDTDAGPANVGLEDIEFAQPATAMGSGRGTDAVTIDFNKYKSSRSSATRP